MELLTLKIKFQMPVHYQMKKILQWWKSVSDLLAETSTLTEVLHEMWKILGIVQIIIKRQEARLFAEFGVMLVKHTEIRKYFRNNKWYKYFKY